jgi:hypothetical protein
LLLLRLLWQLLLLSYRLLGNRHAHCGGANQLYAPRARCPCLKHCIPQAQSSTNADWRLEAAHAPPGAMRVSLTRHNQPLSCASDAASLMCPRIVMFARIRRELTTADMMSSVISECFSGAFDMKDVLKSYESRLARSTCTATVTFGERRRR